LGNRHRCMSPHGCYRCRGDDRWLAISVATDKEWQAFCRAIGDLPWTKEGRFSDSLNRWHNQDELDKLVEGWTIRQDHYDAMHILQGAGVAAGAVLDAREMLSDPQLKERHFFVELPHSQAGTHAYPGFPFKLSETPASFRRAAPCFGEHNEYVLGELLGLSRDEISKLKDEKIISDGPASEK